MRKAALFLAVLFITATAMAASNVELVCSDDDINEVSVSYVSDANLVRAFALDLTTDGNITSVVVVDANYRIYPGQIVIESGEVIDYNTPYAPDDLGDGQVTVEMVSLYTLDSNYAGDPNAGYGMQPGVTGTLLKFYTENNYWYCVDVNALRGGVIMEDPNEDPNVTTCCGGMPPPQCIVPDVVNLPADEAQSRIYDANLFVGDVIAVFSDTIPVNYVVDQDPNAGTVVPCYSYVDLTWVCRRITCATCLGDFNGDNWVRIPDLTAMSNALNSAPAYRIRDTECDYNPCCDINGDGWLRIPDYTAMSNYINTLAAYRCRCDLCGPWY